MTATAPKPPQMTAGDRRFGEPAADLVRAGCGRFFCCGRGCWRRCCCRVAPALRPRVPVLRTCAGARRGLRLGRGLRRVRGPRHAGGLTALGAELGAVRDLAPAVGADRVRRKASQVGAALGAELGFFGVVAALGAIHASLHGCICTVPTEYRQIRRKRTPSGHGCTRYEGGDGPADGRQVHRKAENEACPANRGPQRVNRSVSDQLDDDREHDEAHHDARKIETLGQHLGFLHSAHEHATARATNYSIPLKDEMSSV